MFVVQEVDGMGKTVFWGYTWDSIYMMWLEHPFQITWDGKGQKSTWMQYYGQNVQLGTTLKRDGHTWVECLADKGEYWYCSGVPHIRLTVKGKGPTIGSWIQSSRRQHVICLVQGMWMKWVMEHVETWYIGTLIEHRLAQKFRLLEWIHTLFEACPWPHLWR